MQVKDTRQAVRDGWWLCLRDDGMALIEKLGNVQTSNTAAGSTAQLFWQSLLAREAQLREEASDDDLLKRTGVLFGHWIPLVTVTARGLSAFRQHRLQAAPACYEWVIQYENGYILTLYVGSTTNVKLRTSYHLRN